MDAEITEEFELNDVVDNMHGSTGSRLSLFSKQFRFTEGKCDGNSTLRFSRKWQENFVINPNGRVYRIWVDAIFLWSIFSTFFTPLEFGFFRGMPKLLENLDSLQIVFLADVVLQFFVSSRDPHTYRMVYDRRTIALRYLKGTFAVDILGCFPWDAAYKVTGVEAIRFFVWIRLFRARNINQYFKKMEKDIRINYLLTRILKLIIVQLYCTHMAACILYYLATTLPPEQEGSTWIGSLSMGNYRYYNFREIEFQTRYITSLYFAVVTAATVGYGDIHAVNDREMIFVKIYISLTMILNAYLIGNMTALMVKGSKTEKFRDKMTELIKYMNRNKLGKDIVAQIISHLQLKYCSSYNESSTILDDIPVAVRSKISQTLYTDVARKVPLFKGCSDEFLNQLVIGLKEEIFLPGEVILKQGTAVNQIYIALRGYVEEIAFRKNGSEESIGQVMPYHTFGEIAVLCNIPEPHTVRVCELCQVLQIEKQSLTSTLKVYFKDGHQILRNLLKVRYSEGKINQMESDVTYLIAKQEAELALGVISATYHRDLRRLKVLIDAGADPNKTDYDGRTALHMATCKGYEDIVKFLIHRGANVNSIDRFGNSLLLDALKAGHNRIAVLLAENGAILNMNDAGNYLCEAVTNSKIDILLHLLEYGADPNSRNYDQRTPLHVAASEGLHHVANMLIKHGANVLSKDRWGNTPFDEGQRCGSKSVIDILEQAGGKHTSNTLSGPEK